VTLRYWASARAEAGVAEDEVPVTGPTSLARLRSEAHRLHPGGRFDAVIDSCAVMVDDRPATSRDAGAVMVEPGAIVEFLPPFAGG